MVDAASKHALPEGGAAAIPAHVNSVHFAGMLILHAAKQLDEQQTEMRKLDTRAMLAGMSARLKSRTKQAMTNPRVHQPADKPRVSRQVEETPHKTPARSKIRSKSRIRHMDERMASHGVAAAFLQTPIQDQSTLSEDDLHELVSDSDEPDTISPVVMAKLVSGMTTHKREETLEMLQDLADENTDKPRANKILAVIKYVAPRKGKHFPTGESYKQRKARRAADELMQKEVFRKLRKWDAVCRKARKTASVLSSSSGSINSTPTSTSTRGEAHSIEINGGMQLPLSKTVNNQPESTAKKKSSKSMSEDDDTCETDYYLMIPLERQE